DADDRGRGDAAPVRPRAGCASAAVRARREPGASELAGRTGPARTGARFRRTPPVLRTLKRWPKAAVACRSVEQREADPAVLAPLVLDFADTYGADLTRAANMRAAARLQVDVGDFDQTNPTGAGRRTHRHGAHQLRPRFEFRRVDPAVGDRVVLRDPARDQLGDPVLVDRLALQTEVESALLLPDLAAGYRPGDGGAQQVQRAVHAHQTVAAQPVHLPDHPGADAGRLEALAQAMNDARAVLDRVDHLERDAIPEQQPPAVPRLTAARAVEHGPVEAGAVVDDRRHLGLAALQVGVLPEQLFGHGRSYSRWPLRLALVCR